MPKLSDGQLAELDKELVLGPAMHGREDRRWTLARIRVLIAWRFRIDCPCGGGVAAAAQAWPVPAVSRPPGCEARRVRGEPVEEGRVATGRQARAAGHRTWMQAGV